MSCNNEFIRYLLRVFTKLDDLELTFKTRYHSLTPVTQEDIRGLSTDILIKFLEYLKRLPRSNIADICVENLGDAVAAICGEINVIDIKYILVIADRGDDVASFLKIKDIIQEKLLVGGEDSSKINKATVSYDVPYNIAVPSHIQLLERFGHNLKKIYICMGGECQDFMMNSDTTNTANGDYVDHIFQTCPNLNHIVLQSTRLLNYDPDYPVHDKLRLTLLNLALCSINPSFLTYISRRFSSIWTMELEMCNFVKANGNNVKNPTNVVTDMPHTSFYHITWEYNEFNFDSPLPKFYMKIVEEDYETRYFSGEIGHFDECPETEYEDSLKDDVSLSVYIRCKQVDWIRFNSCDVNVLMCFEYGLFHFTEELIEHIRDD